jgi:hypothetical protein
MDVCVCVCMAQASTPSSDASALIIRVRTGPSFRGVTERPVSAEVPQRSVLPIGCTLVQSIACWVK